MLPGSRQDNNTDLHAEGPTTLPGAPMSVKEPLAHKSQIPPRGTTAGSVVRQHFLSLRQAVMMETSGQPLRLRRRDDDGSGRENDDGHDGDQPPPAPGPDHRPRRLKRQRALKS